VYKHAHLVAHVIVRDADGRIGPIEERGIGGCVAVVLGAVEGCRVKRLVEKGIDTCRALELHEFAQVARRLFQHVHDLDQEAVQVEGEAAEHCAVANGARRIERVAIVLQWPAIKQDGNLARVVVEDGIVAAHDAEVAAREERCARLVAVRHGKGKGIVVGRRRVHVAENKAHDEFACEEDGQSFVLFWKKSMWGKSVLCMLMLATVVYAFHINGADPDGIPGPEPHMVLTSATSEPESAPADTGPLYPNKDISFWDMLDKNEPVAEADLPQINFYDTVRESPIAQITGVDEHGWMTVAIGTHRQDPGTWVVTTRDHGAILLRFKLGREAVMTKCDKAPEGISHCYDIVPADGDAE